MPSNIPYDPSLQLGNVVPPEKAALIQEESKENVSKSVEIEELKLKQALNNSPEASAVAEESQEE